MKTRVASSLLLVAVACDRRQPPPASSQANLNTGVAVVRETFVTAPFDSAANIDALAVFHGRDDAHWLIATATTRDALNVYDAATGAFIRSVGRRGTGIGELRRPSGVVIVGDSVLFVVEQGNARVQGFMLPDFNPIGTFGERVLRLPSRITAFTEKGVLAVYVTDNYETADGGIPPDSALGARVQQFRVTVARGELVAVHWRTFGATSGEGVLRTVGSIVADPAQGRLLIADETPMDSHIKVYDLKARFTGRIIGRGNFPHHAEGIALYACGDSAGYWLATDKSDSTNTFHVFDRISLEHVGGFTGDSTRGTDGVALTQRRYTPFNDGAFFASHLHGAVSAMSWDVIATALRLRRGCN